MRQGVLAIALVLAAFLGGAAVNGRALTWIKSYVAQALAAEDGAADNTVQKVDTPPAQAALAGPPGSPVAPPEAPAPKPAPATEQAIAGGPPAGKPAAPAAEAILPRPPLTLKIPGLGTPARPESPAPPRAPQDPTVQKVAAPEAPPHPDTRTGPAPAASGAGPLDVPAPAPPGAVTPGAQAGPGPGPGDAWKGLRARLKAAGVSRYSIEARPDGRAVFRCLIPVEGLSAVAQQFEAEADDEFLAAEAALRRIHLWRASEETTPGPR